MELAVSGMSIKEIARHLDISPKTVENHRAWVMERTGAKTSPNWRASRRRWRRGRRLGRNMRYSAESLPLALPALE
jgi:DNA-binding NarL/FixJ family response regulator